MMGECSYIMESIAVPNQGVEKYVLRLPVPLNVNSSVNDFVKDGFGNEFHNIKTVKIDESTFYQTPNQEEAAECHIQEPKESLKDLESSTSNKSENNDIEDQDENYTKIYSRKKLTIYSYWDHLPIIKEEEDKEKKEEKQENKIKEEEYEEIYYSINSEDAAKETLIPLCDVFNENLNKVKAQKSMTKNRKNRVSKIEIDAEVIVELISYASKQAEDLDEIRIVETPQQQQNCRLENNKIFSKQSPELQLPGEENNLNTIRVPDKNPIRNFHPLFITAEGQAHELLLKNRKVMKLTKPSPYQRIQKCMDLRRYFGGLPQNYECNLHKEENRVPLWMQKYLYDYRLFLRTFQADEDEQDSLKRLITVPINKESKSKEKGHKQPPLAKVCRLCGEKCVRFVSSGHNVVIKLVSVYLPLVIIEGNKFPLGLCDKCDYSLALICSFMLTYLDCPKLVMNEKKCFTCGSAIESLLTPADRKTMKNLAAAFHGIRFDLREFFGNGQKYLCNACRLSFELLESFREHIWLTNKLFEDGDERLYEMEDEVSKNQFTCELPPGFFRPLTIDTKFRNSVDNCSVEPVIDTESFYKDDFEPRKYFLKGRQRHMVTKFFHRLLGSQYAESTKFQLQKSKQEQEPLQNKGFISALKRGVTRPFQPLKKIFRSAPAENLNRKHQDPQKLDNYEILASYSTESIPEDVPTLLSARPLIDEVETAKKLISKVELTEHLKNSDMSDERKLSLLNFYLGNMNTSLFAYFNADVVLPPDTSEIQSNSAEPQPSTSGLNKVRISAEVHPPPNNSKISTASNDFRHHQTLDCT